MEGGYKLGGKFKGPIDCLIQTVKTEGLKGLYKGGTPPLFGWTIIDSVMFGTYSNFKTYLKKDTKIQSPVAQAMISGLIAGWTFLWYAQLNKLRLACKFNILILHQ